MEITIDLENVPYVCEQLIAERDYMANGICNEWWIPLEEW